MERIISIDIAKAICIYRIVKQVVQVGSDCGNQ